MICAGTQRGGGESTESWVELLGAGVPNVRRDCQTAVAQPSVTKGDESPAGASGHGGEPGDSIHVAHLCKAVMKLSQFARQAGFVNMELDCQAGDAFLQPEG